MSCFQDDRITVLSEIVLSGAYECGKLLQIMKLGILTHQFRGNYGGMLQAYALQQVLLRLGYENDIVDYSRDRELMNDRHRRPYWGARFRAAQAVLGLSRENTPYPRAFMEVRMAEQFLLKNTRHVRVRYPLTADSAVYDYDCWVVGSDQVWRGEYARPMATLPFFFLDFADEAVRRRSIAYAASFGTDDWQGTPEETAACIPPAQQLAAVSVREQSGTEICRSVLGVAAELMPDPTLLLSVADYEALVSTRRTYRPSGRYDAVYILDESTRTRALMAEYAELAADRRLQPLRACPTAVRMRERRPCSVQQWLRYISRAQRVLTDSFHGCVFAIVFNKPFVCFGNAQRGMSRFISLLSHFGLLERLLTDGSAADAFRILNTPVDWAAVNAVRAADCARAEAFLRTHLPPLS